MKQKGVVTCPRGKSRALRLTRNPSETGIPRLGSIPAGLLAEAIADPEEILPIDPNYFGGRSLFALRVLGESMRDAGILDGDVAVIRHQRTVENGEIAAVRIDHEATLKRVFRTKRGLILRAENPAYAEIVVLTDEGREVDICGVLIGIIRKR
jgi:repressor LexA